VRVTILGGGLVGRAVAYRLYTGCVFDEIVVADISDENLRLVRKTCEDKVRVIKVDLLKNVEEAVSGSDVVSCALPGNISFEICRRVLRMGISVVDSSYMPQNPFMLDELAKERNTVYVPDAGFAPGISNILVGYFMQLADELENVGIYVGGLPIKPEGPLNHLVNWSLVDFIDEYLRPARIIKNGEIIEVSPLEDLEKVKIKGREYEAFYTDGLRTLLRTVRAKNMFEKTIRYPGHLERMKFLAEIGLLGEEILDFDGIRIPARKVLEKLLRKHIYRPDMEDRVVLYVTADGGGKQFEAYLEDEYDRSIHISAMAKTTGFTNAIICEAVAEKIREKGVFPPEYIGMKYMEYFKAKLCEHIPLSIMERKLVYDAEG